VVPAIEVKSLTTGYRRHRAIEDVSFSLPQGKVMGLLGPNGSGKSTLIKTLVGLIEPWEGDVCVLGGTPREARRQVGYMPQAEDIDWNFPVTVREMVGMGRYAHLGPWERATSRDRAVVESALERCALVPFAGRQLDRLSGGEQQRARIARALAQEAPVLLLDEPAAGLDLRYRMELFHLLRELRGDGLAVLVITHDLNLAARFADRLLLLDLGRVRASGAPAAVLSRETLEEVYEWPLRVMGHPGPGIDTGAPQTIPLRRDRARGPLV